MVSTPCVWTPSEESSYRCWHHQRANVRDYHDDDEHEIQQFGFNHLFLRLKTGNYNNQSTNI